MTDGSRALARQGGEVRRRVAGDVRRLRRRIRLFRSATSCSARRSASWPARLTDNYPFFHPAYAGQMLKPPHPAAVVGYLAAMLINPNNHALDGGPATAEMEKEVVSQLAAMFGFGSHLGHLTTSGTIANLEALYVARELHPGRGVAYSAEAHYTHGRMCGVLGMAGHGGRRRRRRPHRPRRARCPAGRGPDRHRRRDGGHDGPRGHRSGAQGARGRPPPRRAGARRRRVRRLLHAARRPGRPGGA